VNKQKIRYIHGDQAILDKINLLWEELNEHHFQHSQNFKDHYNQMTFEKRKSDLMKKSFSGKMRVDLAINESSGSSVGYCVSSLNEEKKGEIESIFVNVAYRGLRVGDSLKKTRYHGWMRRALSKKSSRWVMAMIRHSDFTHVMDSCQEKWY
jgi:hypothetical protein